MTERLCRCKTRFHKHNDLFILLLYCPFNFYFSNLRWAQSNTLAWKVQNYINSFKKCWTFNLIYTANTLTTPSRMRRNNSAVYEFTFWAKFWLFSSTAEQSDQCTSICSNSICHARDESIMPRQVDVSDRNAFEENSIQFSPRTTAQCQNLFSVREEAVNRDILISNLRKHVEHS